MRRALMYVGVVLGVVSAATAQAADGGFPGPIGKNDAGCLVWDPSQSMGNPQTMADGGHIAIGGACITLTEKVSDHFRKKKDPPFATPTIPLQPTGDTPIGIPTWDAGFDPLLPFGPGDLPHPSGTCADGQGWSFEGTWEGWIPSGIFATARSAPVYGNNVHIDRLRPPGYTPNTVATAVGGDYWQFSRDVNQQGEFWVGSSDYRKTRLQLPGDRLPESGTGTLISPMFIIGTDFIDFYVGGGSHQSQRVELEILPQGSFTSAFLQSTYDGIGVSEWPSNYAAQTKVDGSWVIVRASSPTAENDYMSRRVAWDVKQYKFLTARIRIVDAVRTWPVGTPEPLQHVNVDLVRCTNTLQAGSVWNNKTVNGLPVPAKVGQHLDEAPLWGTTDTHTHALANLSFGGHLVWGDVSDSLSTVYNCKSASLPPITQLDGGMLRPGIVTSSIQADCFVDLGIILLMDTLTTLACTAVSAGLAAIPFVGPALAAAEIAACTAAVVVVTGELLTSPVMTNYSLHGGDMPISGGLDLGDWLESLITLLTGDPVHIQGVVEELDNDLADGTHSGHGLGRLHQQYQADMIKRAWNGGLRLIVLDTINGRALQKLLDGKDSYDDWQAIFDMVTNLRRLTACAGNTIFSPGPLCNMAAIAHTPGEARRIISTGKLAIVIGTEVDELGKPRTPAMMKLWGHNSTDPDSVDLQVRDLFAFGVRKITPIHGIDNPLGGTGFFQDTYNTSNQYHNVTRGEDGQPHFLSVGWYPQHDFSVPYSFIDPLGGLVLGSWEVGKQKFADLTIPNAGFFQVDSTNPSDWIGEYNKIGFRFGFPSAGKPLTRFRSPWRVGNITFANGEWIHYEDMGIDEELWGGGDVNHEFTNGSLNLVTLNNLGWILGADPGGFGANSRCSLDGAALPISVDQGILDAIGPGYNAATGGHFNSRGLTTKGETFLHAMMEQGMTLDLDHFSQKARLRAYDLAGDFAVEAGTQPFRGLGKDYAVFGVHSDIRGYLKSGPVPLEMANEMGFGTETDRTIAEVNHVRFEGGAFSPALTAAVVPDAEFGDVNNNCDFSSKAWSHKYLKFMSLMKGHGLTPSTDMNGLTTPTAPRFGVNACHTHSTYEQHMDEMADPIEHDRVDNWPRDWRDPVRAACQFNSKGAWLPGCPSTQMVMAQHHEASGVVYDDYATKPFVAIDPSNPNVKRITARSSIERRDDNAPRAKVNEIVTVGRSRQMAPMVKFKNPADPNTSNTGWDINLDGLKHIGLYPDFFQDVRNGGVTWEQLTPLFNASEEYIRMWERNCTLANQWRTAHGQGTINCTGGGGFP